MGNDLERLYLRLRQLEPEDLYKIEADFFQYFYNDKRKAALPPVKTFLIVSGWYGTWFRSGSWVFYESTPKSDIEDAVGYLKEIGCEELSRYISKGIHDWFEADFNYPEEWMIECDDIDNWIADHEKEIKQWMYDYLINNEELFLSL
jgi:hypothetical protein